MAWMDSLDCLVYWDLVYMLVSVVLRNPCKGKERARRGDETVS
jgi:hypothetical protein